MDEKQTLFIEIERHLMSDEKPSVYLDQIKADARMKEFPFHYLTRLENVEQSVVHHPEGNVWIHTMLVTDNAAARKDKSADPRVLMWAALLHDIGKAVTTRLRNGRITAYDHDKEGEKMTEEFLEACGQEEPFVRKVAGLVRWHMQFLFVIRNLPFAETEKMKREAPILEVALLALCDRLGRTGDMDVAKEEENIRIFIKKCEI